MYIGQYEWLFLPNLLYNSILPYLSRKFMGITYHMSSRPSLLVMIRRTKLHLLSRSNWCRWVGKWSRFLAKIPLTCKNGINHGEHWFQFLIITRIFLTILLPDILQDPSSAEQQIGCKGEILGAKRSDRWHQIALYDAIAQSPVHLTPEKAKNFIIVPKFYLK